MADINWLGATWQGVDFVALPKVSGGEASFYDLSGDTLSDASQLPEGVIGHLADGTQVTGTGSGGGASATLTTKEITENGTYYAADDSADGYSEVTVNVPSSSESGMNIQTYLGTDYVRSSSYTATGLQITVKKSGTYTITYMGWRSTSSGTSGTQLYINGSAHGSAHTSFTGTYGQLVKEEGVQLDEGDVVSVRARARNSSYYMYVGNLIIEQTA